ncbi:MAG: hypothetical protein HY763_12360 [Planctomycetes bacterium]|nr:hypothetical protein [Planctomycetota bacterium]
MPCTSGNPDEPAASATKVGNAGTRTRREVVRQGVKLVFVAPVVSSFFARDAVAAGSNHSCYPAGNVCGGATLEPCCDGLTCIAGRCL